MEVGLNMVERECFERGMTWRQFKLHLILKIPHPIACPGAAQNGCISSDDKCRIVSPAGPPISVYPRSIRVSVIVVVIARTLNDDQAHGAG
jgi:hypothetical protein